MRQFILDSRNSEPHQPRPPRAPRSRQEPVEFVLDDSWGVGELQDAKHRLAQIMLTLSDDMVRIKTQIEAAQQKQFDTGQFADRDWWRRAHQALRAKGHQHQRLQATMAEITRRLKDANRKDETKDPARLFVRAARKVLAPEQFERVWDEVRIIRAENGDAA